MVPVMVIKLWIIMAKLPFKASVRVSTSLVKRLRELAVGMGVKVG